VEEVKRPLPEFAHYFGDWVWRSDLTGWVKSLLLFFDGIAVAVPFRVANFLFQSEPYLAQPLIEKGLLRNFAPELWLPEATHISRRDLESARARVIQWEIASASSSVIPMSLLLEYNEEISFMIELYHYISEHIDILLTGKVRRELPPDSWRALMVGITSRLLVQNVNEVAIQPVIKDSNAGRFVASVIGSPARDSRPNIVLGDIARVGIDLSDVPLDEVIDFRRTYGPEYRAYSKEVRDFVLSLSLMTENDRIAAIAARRADFDDRVARLQRIGRQSFKRQSISLGFGLAGAVWTLAHGDPWGAAFAAGATAAGFSRPSLGSIGAAYTYVFRAGNQLAR
jgi:hypothetical protein